MTIGNKNARKIIAHGLPHAGFSGRRSHIWTFIVFKQWTNVNVERMWLLKGLEIFSKRLLSTLPPYLNTDYSSQAVYGRRKQIAGKRHIDTIKEGRGGT